MQSKSSMDSLVFNHFEARSSLAESSSVTLLLFFVSVNTVHVIVTSRLVQPTAQQLTGILLHCLFYQKCILVRLCGSVMVYDWGSVRFCGVTCTVW